MKLRLILIWTIFLVYFGVIVYFFTRNDADSQDKFAADTTSVLDVDSSNFQSLQIDVTYADSLINEIENAIRMQDFDKALALRDEILASYPGSDYATAANLLIDNGRFVNAKESQTSRLKFRASSSRKPKITKSNSRKKFSSSKDFTPTQANDIAKRETILENERQVKNALTKMRKIKDKQQKITWYFNKDITHYIYKNSFETYLGQSNDGKIWLKLRIYYSGDKRLNINSYQLYVDDHEYTISTLYGKIEHGRGRGGAWEWYDVQVAPKEIGMLKAVMDANRTAIRYIGENGTWERTVTVGEKIRLMEVMKVYDALSTQKKLLAANRNLE